MEKSTGFYRCPDDVANFVVRVVLKEIRTSVPLRQTDADGVVSCTFSWQRKVLSRAEIERYADDRNCTTDLHKSYHDLIDKEGRDDGLLFSYVDEDDYVQPDETYVEGSKSKVRRRRGRRPPSAPGVENAPYDIRFHLERSLSSAAATDASPVADDAERMYLMADLGETMENVWLSAEHVLCKLEYDPKTKFLQLYPDFSPSMDEPYVVEIKRDRRCVYHYYVFNVSKTMPSVVQSNEAEIVAKINRRLRVNRTEEVAKRGFATPPKNRLDVQLYCEILSGSGFEYDDVFVRYFVDLPTNWRCDAADTLHGVTHTSRTRGRRRLAHFGYAFDLYLNYDVQSLEICANSIPATPFLYVEVVSRDGWDRYRTEGLAYKALPVSVPGEHRLELRCLRVLPRNVSGELRRFFVGDYHTLEDVTWVGVPADYKNSTMNKYGVDTIGTGTLQLRMHVVQQSRAFLKESNGVGSADKQERFIWERLNAVTLVKSVEQVLAAFKKARRHMKQARKNV